jgi:hypothetical protein|nr:MAG TPA: hypothetical protein [Caudoviricetes sp.]
MSVGEIVAAVGLMGGALIWIIHAVISPLEILLDRVVKSLDKLDETLKEERTKREQIELKLENVNQRSRSNTHRISQLETRNA